MATNYTLIGGNLNSPASYVPVGTPGSADTVDVGNAPWTFTGTSNAGIVNMSVGGQSVSGGTFTGGTFNITGTSDSITLQNINIQGLVSIDAQYQVNLNGGVYFGSIFSTSFNFQTMSGTNTIGVLFINDVGDYENNYGLLTVLQLDFSNVNGSIFDFHSHPIPQPALGDVKSGVSTPFGLGTYPGGGTTGVIERNRLQGH